MESTRALSTPLLIPADRRSLLPLLLAALIGPVLCLASVWFTSGGHFVLPLDDSYIHLQYARMVAEGAPFTYAPGSAASGGATSPLWVLLLSPFFLLGLGGVKGAAAAFLLGAALWPVAVVLTWWTARSIATPSVGLMAGWAVALNGHLLWNFCSGMETGLFAVLVLWAIATAQRFIQSESRMARRCFFAALLLLPLARPEGFGLVLVAFAWLFFRRGEKPRIAAWWALLALLPGILWLILLRQITGEWKPAGLIAKGLLDRPDLSPMTKLGIAAEHFQAIFFRFYQNQIPDDGYALFKGTSTLPYVPVVLLPLALFGAGWAMLADLRSRAPGAMTLLGLLWLAGLFALCVSAIPFIHQQRYLAPWTPLAIIAAAVGIRRLAALFQQQELNATRALGFLFLVLTLPTLPFWIAEFGRNGRDIFHQHRVFTFLMESAPPNERYAVTDTGVLVYYPQRPADDLVGLTTARYARPFLHGGGAVLEALANTPMEERPRTLITYREWFVPAFPLGEAESGTRLPETSITSGLFLGQYPIDWNRMDRAEFPGDSLWSLNVGDLAEESAARHRSELSILDERRRDWTRPSIPIVRTPGDGVEGARMHRTESFDLTLPADADWNDLVYVVRVGNAPAASSLQATARVLEVNAQSLGTGLGAKTLLPLPEIPSGESADVELPLGELLHRAGGAGAWRITIRAAEPAGALFLTARHRVRIAVPEAPIPTLSDDTPETAPEDASFAPEADAESE